MTVRRYETKLATCAICLEPHQECTTPMGGVGLELIVEGKPDAFEVCESCVNNMARPFSAKEEQGRTMITHPFDRLSDDARGHANELWQKLRKLLVTDTTTTKSSGESMEAIAIAVQQAESLGHLVGFRAGARETERAMKLAASEVVTRYEQTIGEATGKVTTQ